MEILLSKIYWVKYNIIKLMSLILPNFLKMSLVGNLKCHVTYITVEQCCSAAFGLNERTDVEIISS